MDTLTTHESGASTERASTTPRGPRRTLRGWLVAIAIIACGLAVLPAPRAVALAVFVVAAGVLPVASRWERYELSAALGWACTVVCHAYSAELYDVAIDLVLGLAIGVSWLLRTVLILAGFRRQPWYAWLLVPACTVAGVSLVASDLELKVRLLVSEHALIAESNDRSTSDDWWFAPAHGTLPVGAFQVHQMDRKGPLRRWWTGRRFLDGYGVAYCPEGEPTSDAMFSYTHLYGPWYRFSEGTLAPS